MNKVGFKSTTKSFSSLGGGDVSWDIAESREREKEDEDDWSDKRKMGWGWSGFVEFGICWRPAVAWGRLLPFHIFFSKQNFVFVFIFYFSVFIRHLWSFQAGAPGLGLPPSNSASHLPPPPRHLPVSGIIGSAFGNLLPPF